MEYNEIKEKVNQFLVTDFEVPQDRLVPEASLKDALDLDSLDYIDLIVVIENNFGLKVNPEDFQTMQTLGDFYGYIHTRLQQKLAV